MPIVTVCASAPESRYDIHIGHGLLKACAPLFAPYRGRRAAIVADSNTAPLYSYALMEQLHRAGVESSVIVLPAGEATKCPEELARLYDAFLDFRLTRADLVIALGGGVVGDIAGYAACTYLRGVHFVQVPTTLLAQVDSSVGGKVAVNHPRGKNLLGAFYQPELVLIDCDTLQTLDERQVGAGLGEVIKYGCICDRALFERIETLGSRAALTPVLDEIIARCCALKAEYVRVDPHDHGVRMQLNFGHTLAHALENAMGYGTLLHGEAVTIGMVAAARWGEALGMTPEGTSSRIRAVLRAYGLMTDVPAGLSPDALAGAMALDKKAEGRTVRAVILTEIGACKGVPLTPAQLKAFL
ncbi:MAG: 3-dehydroquinate synthase [Clostridia bacterium]|nr:3-dehydroquinate synthase [Clostridia bacterium]MBQ7051840.1 3-dehydroquinate synthase [Clostridia bacterium]